jgi:tyrosine-specific transport protein
MNISIGKFIGCVMILIGTTIGAGMLELPMISVSAGFSLSTLLLVTMCVLSIITGFIVVEVTLSFPMHSCSFSTMAEVTLGQFGKIITWISYLFLLYAMTAAYVAGGGSLIASTLHIKSSSFVNAISFTLVMGIPIFFGTKAVDYCNRGLISLKGILLFTSIILVLPKINTVTLFSVQEYHHPKYLWAAAPIFGVAFFYHFVIPSLRIYIGDKPKELNLAILISAFVSFAIYLLWIIISLGTVPVVGSNSFAALAQMHHIITPTDFINTMTGIINNAWVTASISGFSNVALTTSFLGVTLGLFDFLADGFKISNTKTGRLKTAILTFVPPIVFATLYPDGFAVALYYAAIPTALLSLILPVLMAYRLRRHPKLSQIPSQYRMFGGKKLFIFLGITGIIMVVLPVLANLNLLPTMHI